MAAVIVHGGAGDTAASVTGCKVAGCKIAAEKAYQLLQSGKSALDAGKIIVNVVPSL